jgi:hypothetical protein
LTNWQNSTNVNFPFAYTNSDPQRIEGDVNFNPSVDFDGNDFFRTDPSTGTLNYTSYLNPMWLNFSVAGGEEPPVVESELTAVPTIQNIIKKL